MKNVDYLKVGYEEYLDENGFYVIKKTYKVLSPMEEVLEQQRWSEQNERESWEILKK